MEDKQTPDPLLKRGAVYDVGIGIAAGLGTEGVKATIKQVVNVVKKK